MRHWLNFHLYLESLNPITTLKIAIKIECFFFVILLGCKKVEAYWYVCSYVQHFYNSMEVQKEVFISHYYIFILQARNCELKSFVWILFIIFSVATDSTGTWSHINMSIRFLCSQSFASKVRVRKVFCKHFFNFWTYSQSGGEHTESQTENVP